MARDARFEHALEGDGDFATGSSGKDIPDRPAQHGGGVRSGNLGGLGIGKDDLPVTVDRHQRIVDSLQHLLQKLSPRLGIRPKRPLAFQSAAADGPSRCGPQVRASRVFGTERFREIIVCPRRQPLDASLFARLGRQQHDQQMHSLRIAPQRGQHAKSVQAWHHDVRQDQVGGPFPARPPRPAIHRRQPGPGTARSAAAARSRTCRHCRQPARPAVAFQSPIRIPVHWHAGSPLRIPSRAEHRLLTAVQQPGGPSCTKGGPRELSYSVTRRRKRGLLEVRLPGEANDRCIPDPRGFPPGLPRHGDVPTPAPRAKPIPDPSWVRPRVPSTR